MATISEMTRTLTTVFDPGQAQVLAQVIHDAYDELVKTSDFRELKEIVRELAEAQKQTESKVSLLSDRMDEMAQALTQLAIESKNMRIELGGISNSLGYSLENEAYRKLPKYLKDNHGIEITERMIRREVAGEEINFFGRGRRNGKPVLVVGETKFRLTSGDFAQLDRKLDAVKREYQSEEIVPLLVTHFASDREKERATNRGVIVAQSFEWD